MGVSINFEEHIQEDTNNENDKWKLASYEMNKLLKYPLSLSNYILLYECLENPDVALDDRNHEDDIFKHVIFEVMRFLINISILGIIELLMKLFSTIHWILLLT